MRIETVRIDYQVLNIVARTIRLAIQYERLTGRNLGITGEVGEVLVCKKLKLKLVANPLSAGFDAVDSRGRTYQIKTRRSDNRNGRTGRFSEHVFHFAILAILDRSYKIVGLYRVPFKSIQPVIQRNKRKNPSVKQFVRVADSL